MRHKAIIALTPGYNMEAAPPDLEPFLVTAGWRYDLEKRIKVYVTADGREIDRKALSQREIDTYKETHMAKSKYPEIQVGQVFGELTVREVLAERDKLGAIQILCDCSCGVEKVANKYLLQSGQTKSCGHLKRAGRPSKAETPVQAIAPRTASGFNLKSIAQQIEGLTQLFKAVPLASVGAVRDELRRLKEHAVSPLFDDHEKLDDYLSVTNWFYESRAALAELEAK
jgi:hypothetical protein